MRTVMRAWREEADGRKARSLRVAVPVGTLVEEGRRAPGDDEAARPIALGRGRVTVKEDIGVNTGIFQGRGILAEFKLVGSFDVSPRAVG